MKLIQCMIKLYQSIISPFIGSNCRFYPSCSQYTSEALARFGTIKGLWLASCRILRCHPWANGGYDPIPEEEKI